MVVQRIDRDQHLHQVFACHRHEDVQIAFDQRVLGDDGARVMAFGEQFQCGAGQPPLLLDRLVGIGVAADVDRADHVAGFGQLRAQHLGEIALGAQLRFKIEAGRQVEVAVRRSRKTINAAVFAAAIRVDRLAEGDVRRVVAADHAARAFLGDLGARAWRILVQQRALPAVVLGLMADAFEAALGIGRSTAALERAGGAGRIGRRLGQWTGRRWMVHPRSFARRGLNARDILAM